MESEAAGTHAILACSRDSATVFDSVTGRAVARMRSGEKILAAAIIGSDESVYATYDHSGLLTMWNLHSAEQISESRPPVPNTAPSYDSACLFRPQHCSNCIHEWSEDMES